MAKKRIKIDPTLHLKERRLYNLNYKKAPGRSPTRVIGEYSNYIDKVNAHIEQAYEINKQELRKQHRAKINVIKANVEKRGYEIRTPNAKKVFFSTVKSYIKEGYDLNDAITMTFNSEWFTPNTVRGPYNAMRALQQDKEAYKAFREAYGWRKKIDWSKMSYDNTEGMYVLGDASIKMYTYHPPVEGIVTTEIAIYKNGKTFSRIKRRYDEETGKLMDRL